MSLHRAQRNGWKRRSILQRIGRLAINNALAKPNQKRNAHDNGKDVGAAAMPVGSGGGMLASDEHAQRDVDFGQRFGVRCEGIGQQHVAELAVVGLG